MLPQNGSDFMWLLKWVKNCLEILLVEIIPSSPSVWHPWTLQMQWTAEQTFLWHLNCVFKQWYPKAKSGANILHHYWYLWSCNYLRLSSHTISTKHLSVGGFAALHDKHSINPPKKLVSYTHQKTYILITGRNQVMIQFWFLLGALRLWICGWRFKLFVSGRVDPVMRKEYWCVMVHNSHLLLRRLKPQKVTSWCTWSVIVLVWIKHCW